MHNTRYTKDKTNSFKQILIQLLSERTFWKILLGVKNRLMGLPK